VRVYIAQLCDACQGRGAGLWHQKHVISAGRGKTTSGRWVCGSDHGFRNCPSDFTPSERFNKDAFAERIGMVFFTNRKNNEYQALG
jgi:hypothetical protein